MMEGLLQLLAGSGLLAVFALLAAEFGADSRDGYGDDHAQRAQL